MATRMSTNNSGCREEEPKPKNISCIPREKITARSCSSVVFHARIYNKQSSQTDTHQTRQLLTENSQFL